MVRVKYLLFLSAVLTVLFFLFFLEFTPEHFNFQEFFDLAPKNDVIIIFNSGGWGNTPLEEAKDFSPVIKEIEIALNNLGYRSAAISYNRNKDDLLGRFAAIKDFLRLFDSSSRFLAEDIDRLAIDFPDKKIIIAGLSNGGAFVKKTMEKISDEAKDSIFVVSAGIPFWYDFSDSKNILHLTNDGKDSLAVGEPSGLMFSLIKTPFKWVYSKISGENLAFARAFQAPGHNYSWNSVVLGLQIEDFFGVKLR